MTDLDKLAAEVADIAMQSIQEHFDGIDQELRSLAEQAEQRRSDYRQLSRKYDLARLDPDGSLRK